MFGPVSHTPPHVHPVGHKWVFVRKRNEKKQGLLHKVSLNIQEMIMKKPIPRSWAELPLDIYLNGSTLEFRSEIDGCGNSIPLWNIGFGHLYEDT